jgi:hypothetical protein
VSTALQVLTARHDDMKITTSAASARLRQNVEIGAASMNPRKLTCAIHPGHPAVGLGDGAESPGGEDLDALFLRVPDFPIVRRHLLPAFEARHPHPGRAESAGAHRRIDGHVSAAQHQHAFPAHPV